MARSRSARKLRLPEGAVASRPFSYQRLPSFVLGFHGCDESIGRRVLNNPGAHLRKSTNPYDWLGDGIYFWENDPERAMQFAKKGMDGRVTRGKIKKPFVVGAVINLGLCCNLFDQAALQELRAAHSFLKAEMDFAELRMPENKGGLRKLDRVVVEFMHQIRADSDFPPYETTRSGFIEGDELYPGTQLRHETHIQIAVRDPACILGYFLPRG